MSPILLLRRARQNFCFLWSLASNCAPPLLSAGQCCFSRLGSLCCSPGGQCALVEGNVCFLPSMRHILFSLSHAFLSHVFPLFLLSSPTRNQNNHSKYL
ncbi:uncharacterized protein DS421_7g212410 [Arachis hypogaea]|nr:uncharacterized protein DS421_7g212410 [Arachis hypogaea]